MNITTKLNDPVAKIKLVDAYFRWALLALAEVVGERGLDLVLKTVGMEKYSQVYASDKLEVVSDLEYNDYAKIMMGLINIFGKGDLVPVFHSGRVSARYAMRKNGEMFNPPVGWRSTQDDLNQQIRTSLETILHGYHKIAAQAGQDYHAWIEETDTCFYFHLESCAVCAGLSSNEPVCMFFSGSLMECLKWFTGRRFHVREVACRSMNDQACVWEINKLPGF